MLNNSSPSRDAPDALDEGFCNFRSIWQFLLLAGGQLSVGVHTFALDPWSFNDQLLPVNVALKGRRVRMYLTVPSAAGPRRVSSVMFGGGFNNTCIFQNGTELNSGAPADAMFLALHDRLSASLPVVTESFESFVGLGPIVPHYAHKMAESGARRALLDWPVSPAGQLIPTVLAVMVEAYNQFVAIAREWEQSGQILLPPRSESLLLPAPVEILA